MLLIVGDIVGIGVGLVQGYLEKKKAKKRMRRERKAEQAALAEVVGGRSVQEVWGTQRGAVGPSRSMAQGTRMPTPVRTVKQTKYFPVPTGLVANGNGAGGPFDPWSFLLDQMGRGNMAGPTTGPETTSFVPPYIARPRSPRRAPAVQDAYGRWYCPPGMSRKRYDPATGQVWCSKPTRMNVLNPKALMRAMRRVKGFAGFAKQCISFTKQVRMKKGCIRRKRK